MVDSKKPEGLIPVPKLDDVSIETLAVRAGQIRSPQLEHSEAIFPTSSFVFNSAEEAAARFASAQAIRGNRSSGVPRAIRSGMGLGLGFSSSTNKLSLRSSNDSARKYARGAPHRPPGIVVPSPSPSDRCSA